ncbi:MAG: carboxy-terminal-processing protease, carboxyl-terminal processing protease [Candidatus Parcubacteria bacterium]|jgi:carboxyl-terminal processing protease
MQQLSKNVLYATLSIVLVLSIFSGGFYVGQRGIGFERAVPANASTPADMSAFWEVWNLVEERYVPATADDAIDDQARIEGAIQGMVDAIGDPYTTFLTAEQNAKFEESVSGKFQGVGMEIGRRDGLIVVIAPIKASPAEKAGIKTGDVILQINEESTADMTVDQAVQKIRGEKGTDVTFIIAREDDRETKSVTVTRDEIRIPTLEYEHRKDGVFVISLFNFSAGVEKEFREALRQFVLSKSDKLVLDMRGNPGGFLDAAVDVSSWFLPVGKVVVRESFGAEQPEKVFRSKGYNIFNGNLKMVVLVDNGSASASEIVAGALKEHGVATIVGETTYGKGSVQELIELPNDTALKVTIAQWLTPNGASISKNGLKPDIEVEQVQEQGEPEKDTQLERAIEIVKGNR